MKIESRITQAVEKILEEKGDQLLFLVDVVIPNAKNSQKVLVHLDGDGGVNIDTCAEISRKLGSMLEEEGLISGSFTLEVSSPGLDLPLKLQRQYYKNRGRKVKVLTQDDVTHKGTLKEVSDEHIIIEEQPKGKEAQRKKKGNTKEVLIPFQEIKKTNVLASFK
jgi:ribosome maturation factor RimP